MAKNKSFNKLMAGTMTAAMVAGVVAPVAASAAENAFKDVPANHWSADAINDMAKKGIIVGIGDGLFGFGQDVTRAQVATFMVKAKGLQNETATPSFSDVDASSPYAKFIGIAEKNKIMAGLGEGKFGPNEKLTRAQMAQLIVNAYGFKADDKNKQTFSDIDNLSWATAKSSIETLASLKVVSGVGEGKFDPNGVVSRQQAAQFIYNAMTYKPAEQVEVKVTSVKALSKTSVEVKFDNKVDAVKAENFTINGAAVKSATLSEDKKTATLDVSGLELDTKYSVAIKDVLVNTKKLDLGTHEFQTLSVADLWELKVDVKDAQLDADGADNTEVTFSLIDKATNKVDEKADDIVLALNTTYGNLAHNRVTIQDGKATVVLTSEFSPKELTAKIDAQLIEASEDYKHLIGKVLGTTNVKFVPAANTGNPEEKRQLSVVKAESNQADRVVAYFDKDVTLADFIATTSTGDLKLTADKKAYVLKNNVSVEQEGKNDIKIKGIRAVSGNKKAVELILEKDSALIDNKEVKVKADITVPSETKFVLTDARVPEVTSVKAEGLNTLKVKFSEAVAEGTFKIDGQFDNSKFDVTYGEFNPVTFQDDRNVATITLKDSYKEAAKGAKAGFFMPGKHSLQVSSLKDFAALTDNANIGSTQNLSFEVAEDKTKPSAAVKVESPEQFRVAFSKGIKEQDLQNVIKLQKQVVNPDTKAVEWKTTDVPFNVKKVASGDYVIELTKDWTEIYNTKGTKNNYYNDKYRIQIAKDTLTSATNGEKNDELNLSLNYDGSPLNTPDTKSPVIKDIVGTDVLGKFVVTMDEPVKLAGKDDAGETLNQDQTKLPETSVQFIGKDKDGKTVTFDGTVGGYADGHTGADMSFEVSWNAGETTPQTVVDAGGNTVWTVVVKSLSDDVGNTAATVTKDFAIKKTPEAEKQDTPFKIVTVTGEEKDANDVVTITFTEGVQFKGGVHDATNPAQYTLNGQKLPTGTQISVEDKDAKAEGLETVVITLPKGQLKNSASNTITVNKNLTSHDGSVLEGGFEKTFQVK
ncbi:S-layer homology domain-containing protein [Bacillus mobilis]|uniref:S-layer homology domain-containing protein n=1 Tax=Bacillus mobilis TaxID=2026190 RepID=UPI003D064E42